MTDTVDIRPIILVRADVGDRDYLAVELTAEDLPETTGKVVSISCRLPPDGPVLWLALRMEYDEDNDISLYGSFSERPESDLAIEHEPHDSRTFNWFNPNTDTHETPEHAREAYERVMKIERGDIDVVGLIAKVCSPTGTLLGEVSCWGIEVEWHPPHSEERENQEAYLVGTMEDIVMECLLQAMEDYDKLMETVDAVRVLRRAVGLGE